MKQLVLLAKLAVIVVGIVGSVKTGEAILRRLSR